ncbi:hypothetical protein ABT288_37275 [Streptomyces sp. NPDC001093]|uniref:hypothetical protein n=1 Tax=Streptomyces sp. NPDC001093 TaxID=3154376 RepID=UPI0033240053
MNIDIEEWAKQGRPAIRDMIDALGGDLAAFDHDPLSAMPLIDDFLLRTPWEQFELDDWVWLHAQLVAFVAEVLIHHYDGTWKAFPAPETPPGWRPVIELLGRDQQLRHVAVVDLVHEELHPVPQRIPRLIERATALAGHGPEH